MLDNRLSGARDHNRLEGKGESNGVMSNLLRSELLGEPVSFNAESRMDGLLTSPPRKESGASNLFKYRSSQVISILMCLVSHSQSVAIDVLAFVIYISFV